jgi:tRNA G18 (ribose-2'-O)-methylase SpoU
LHAGAHERVARLTPVPIESARSMGAVMNAEYFFNLKERDLRREGVVIGEGRFLAERMLSSGWEMLGLLCSERFAARYAGLAHGRCPVTVKTDSEIAAATGFNFHRGVMAACRRPGEIQVRQCVENNAEIERIVICPDVTNAANLGSIMRSAAAFGCDLFVTGRRSCDPLGRMGLRASMGAPFTLRMAVMENEGEDAAYLRKRGYELYGTVIEEGAERLEEFASARRHALVFGSEADGLSAQWRGWCDRLVTIPIRSRVDSLNVGVAAGIFLHHLSMKRR